MDLKIFYHADCPDGIASAEMLRLIALASSPDLEIYKIPLSHTQRLGIEDCKDSIVVFADISPYLEDITKLDQSNSVIIIDHHASVRERVKDVISKTKVHVIDISDSTTNNCAASLVHHNFQEELTRLGIVDLDRKVDILRANDVWNYQAYDSSVAAYVNAYFRQSTSLEKDVVDFLCNPNGIQRCSRLGKPIYQEQVKDANSIVSDMKVIAENTNAIVLHTTIRNNPILSHAINESTRFGDKAVLLLYQNGDQMLLGHAARADSIDCGSICSNLCISNSSTFKCGGGHPFASGVYRTRSNINVVQIAECILSYLN